MSFSLRSIQACLAALLLSACGDAEQSGTGAVANAAPARVYWRSAVTKPGWNALRLRAERSCFLQFRVEGSNDQEHG